MKKIKIFWNHEHKDVPFDNIITEWLNKQKNIEIISTNFATNHMCWAYSILYEELNHNGEKKNDLA